MANKWTYRRVDAYWLANQEIAQLKRRVNIGTTDIVAPFDTPRRLSPQMQQMMYPYRLRVRKYALGAQRPRRLLVVGPTTYTQNLTGNL